MTSELDPVRLLDDEGQTPALRAILRAGRDELPDDDAVARIAARVAVAIAGGGGGTSGGGEGGAGAGSGAASPTAPSSATGLSATTGGAGAVAPGGGVLGALSLAVVVGGVAVLAALVVGPAVSGTRLSGLDASAAPAPALVAEVAEPAAATRPPGVRDAGAMRAPPSGTVSVIPSGSLPLPPAPARVAEPSDRPPSASSRAAEPLPVALPPAPAPDELTLVSDAQRSLAGAPADALSLAERATTLYPDGSLAQEREMVAVNALLALGRVDEARARADRFRARWPRSPHVRRLDVLLPPASP